MRAEADRIVAIASWRDVGPNGSAEPSNEVKIEAGQRRAHLMQCATLGEGPEIDSDEPNAIDQIDHGFLSFAVVS